VNVGNYSSQFYNHDRCQTSSFCCNASFPPSSNTSKMEKATDIPAGSSHSAKSWCDRPKTLKIRVFVHTTLHKVGTSLLPQISGHTSCDLWKFGDQASFMLVVSIHREVRIQFMMPIGMSTTLQWCDQPTFFIFYDDIIFINKPEK